MSAGRFSILIMGMLIVLGISTPAVTALAADPDVLVVASDDYGTTLELIPPQCSPEDAPGGTSGEKRLRIRGWASTTQPGFPELPVKSVLIQTPVSGDITLEVIENTFDTVPVGAIRTVSGTATAKNGKAGRWNDGTTASSSDFLPGVSAEVSSRSTVRGVPVARIFFYPFRWNPSTQDLRRTQRMLVRVHFSEPFSASSADASLTGRSAMANPIMDGLKETVLNYRGTGENPSPTVSVSGSAAVASQTTAVRMEVTQNGVYRISWSDLTTAKASPQKINPATFRLLNQGKEIAVKLVTKTANKFVKGDYIEFYAQGIDTAFTGTNVYWLYWGGASGARVTPVDGSVTGAGQLSGSFYSTVHAEENHVVWGGTPGAPDTDYWTWAKLTAPTSASYSVPVPSPVTDGSDAVVKVCFQGYTNDAVSHPNHHTRILLNGTVIGDASWDGAVVYTQEIAVPSNLLTDGANTVTVALPGDTGAIVDTILLNWIEISYPRRYEAVNGALTFSAQGSGRTAIQVTGSTGEDLVLYDITDPKAVKPVTGFSVQADGHGGYTVSFEDDPAGSKTWTLTTSALVSKPANLKLCKSTGLSDASNGADYILITPRDFIQAAQPLITFRKQQKLRVTTVSVEDIYDEFSHGLPDPQAIKDFLTQAYTGWKRPAPSYVLLLGDATIDYRNYLNAGKVSRVPTHFAFETTVGLICTDNWFVAVDGNDALPDMMIGRIPAASAQAVSGVVKKIVAYEKLKKYQPQKALFVADSAEPSFQDDSETLISALTSGYEAERVYLASYANVATATQDILTRMNEGMLISNYIGHGNMTQWAAGGLFQPSDVSLLGNPQKLTFVVALDCLNGYFALTDRYCLGEEFVIAGNGGSMASFATSGLGYEWENQLLGEQVFQSIFQKKNAVLGVIATQSKINAYASGASEDLVNNFTLLGDPATRLKIRQ